MQEQHVIVHLSELRKRLFITISAFLLFFVATFIYVQDIYQWLVSDLSFTLAVLGPSDILWVYLLIASVVSLAGTIPIAAYQLWLFVRPALSKKEQKVTLAYIPAIFLLFTLGISFGYFVLFPIILSFLLSLSADMVETFFTTEKYFQFMLQMTLPFGFLFELPIVIMFLTSLGILNPYRLQKSRKYAYFALVVISILITPPDFLSDVLVIIPLLFLYECSVVLSKFIYKRNQRRMAAEAVAS